MFSMITIKCESNEILRKVLNCIGHGQQVDDQTLRLQSGKSSFRLSLEIEERTGLKTETHPNMIIVSN